VVLSSIRNAIARSQSVLGSDAALQSLRARYASLTKREREVMGLVVSGLMNKQIGGSLGTSEITVKAHRGKVMRKMEAESLADLVRMGQRLAL
jgi:FixJ family two-component response regulator